MSRQPLDPTECRALVQSDRWLSKITVSGDCWLLAYSNSRHGYAGVRLGSAGPMVLAHRVALVAKLGRDIEPGMQAGHTCHDIAVSEGLCHATDSDPCDHRRCVNPDHIEEQSPRTNTLSGRTLMATNAAKMICPAGHSLTDEVNLRPADLRKGWRACLTCQKARLANRERLVSAAAKSLGLTNREYVALYGRSVVKARDVIAAKGAAETQGVVLL